MLPQDFGFCFPCALVIVNCAFLATPHTRRNQFTVHDTSKRLPEKEGIAISPFPGNANANTGSKIATPREKNLEFGMVGWTTSKLPLNANLLQTRLTRVWLRNQSVTVLRFQVDFQLHRQLIHFGPDEVSLSLPPPFGETMCSLAAFWADRGSFRAYFTRHQTAHAPSFQPIFLPSS